MLSILDLAPVFFVLCRYRLTITDAIQHHGTMKIHAYMRIKMTNIIEAEIPLPSRVEVELLARMFRSS